LKHPEYQYPPYFKAKLLLAIGDKENSFSAFLPFAKKKRNDFWVWDALADAFSEKEKKIACFCKALSLKTPEDYLVKTRQKLADLLINEKKYDEAKTEIEQIIKVRENNKWKIPPIIKQWQKQDWYSSAKSLGNNKEFYLRHAGEAEEVLFDDIPEEIVVVEFINKNKHILNFVKDKAKNGFFNYESLLKDPQIGDILSVRIKSVGNEGFYKAITVKQMPRSTETSAIKEFEGRINIIPPHNFGFVDDVFFEPNIINNNNIAENQPIKGSAILSFNKNKKEWGWKAFEVNV